MATTCVKEQILTAAGPVFAEHGFKDATVREICREAGVNVAAVNYYFGDKQRLYVETIKQAQELKSNEVPLPSWSNDVRPEQRLEDFIRMLLLRMIGPGTAHWPTRLMLREVLRPTGACDTLVEDYFRPVLELLLSIVDDLVTVPLTPARRYQLAFGIVGQCFFYRAAGDLSRILLPGELLPEFEVDQLVDHICESSLNILRHVSASPDHSADQ